MRVHPGLPPPSGGCCQRSSTTCVCCHAGRRLLQARRSFVPRRRSMGLIFNDAVCVCDKAKTPRLPRPPLPVLPLPLLAAFKYCERNLKRCCLRLLLITTAIPSLFSKVPFLSALLHPLFPPGPTHRHHPASELLGKRSCAQLNFSH